MQYFVKVCWMYRQGRCRFGRRCKMFHDSELRDSLLTSINCHLNVVEYHALTEVFF